MPLLHAGSAYRSITGPPHRFALRVYVPQQDLDAVYAPGITRALDPFTAGVHELSEQLARLCDTSQPLLPPARDPLWRMPFSTAPAGARRLAGTSGDGASRGSARSAGTPPAPAPAGDFPVFHPTQRLRRSLRLFTAAEDEDSAQLLPLLVPEGQVDDAARATSRESFLPVYTRESAYVVPLAWFAAFSPEDRVVSRHSGHEVHRLVAPADAAARRALQAAQTVDDAGRAVSGDAPEDDLPDEARQAAAFAHDLTRLGRWLGTFGPASLVSLDYGALADRIQPDESPQDMSDAVELLREGDFGSATAALRRIFMRWAPLAQLQQAN